jgi:hypothetical protein
MSPWNLLEPSNYDVTGPVPFSLASATFAFDGVSTVTIGLRAAPGQNLQSGSGYTLQVNDVWSAQGVQRTSIDVEGGIVAAGDAVPPTVAIGSVRLDPNNPNALLIEADEALDNAATATASNYDYDGGNIALTAVRLGQRTIRATFGTTPVAGNNLQLTVTDLAGNVSGTITRAVTAADVSGPLVSTVAGVIRPGVGGDVVNITYSEPVTTSTALLASNYTVTSGPTTLNLANVRLAYSSVTNTVTLFLPDLSELDANFPVNVTIANVQDYSGNAMSSQITLGGAVTGDTLAPSISSSFVNLREDPSGTVIDVRFDEDVDVAYASFAAHWTASGGQTVTSVTMPERDHARVTLSAALGASQTLAISNVPDLAKNVSSALTTNPEE